MPVSDSAGPEGGLALYVHWPFCAAKCPYCDFNSHVRPEVDGAAYGEALVRELKTVAARQDRRQPLDSIFFGGGTPSLMAPAAVGAVIENAHRLFGFKDDIEITLEANPTSTDATRFAGYAAAGVNRVSIGIQALNDADLKALGRWHSASEARAAFGIARATFPRVSFDLIYARPEQSAADWSAELTEALSFAADHLSLYQLTVEPETKFGALYEAGRLSVPDSEYAAALYEITQELCEAACLPQYEISNHARPGEESRHNLVYWRYGEFLGVGPGAHGRVRIDGTLKATATERRPEHWLAAVNAAGDGLVSLADVSDSEQAEEYLVMALRLAEGLDAKRYARLAGRPLDASRLTMLADEGLVATRADRVAATPAGRLVLNALAAELAR